mmetsp:Transcript_36261/g.93500  ORF Transcript_36261/g.93500 Transcript_36261/m.93500 type:complete len:316 (-) Transcript_36261:178-1125(-)
MASEAAGSSAAAAAVAAAGIVETAFFRPSEGKRGIPEAIFIDNVEAMCEKENVEPTAIVVKLQELYNKYQYMQSSIVAQRSSLKTKLPDISSALEVVNHLVDKKSKASEGEPTKYTYQLAENIWAKAEAGVNDNVCLWLGANVMLEYSLEEAVELLTANEKNARETVKNLDEDMAFLRDQITTTEVNIARTHNYGVKQRQKLKEQQEKSGGENETSSFAPAPRTGGAKGAYTWKQESEEVELSVPMPKGAAKSDIKVTILAESIKVAHDGKVLLEGQLAGKCSVSGSTWTMTGSRVEITLQKAVAGEKWATLFED